MIDVTIANNLHVDFEELNEDRSSIINYIEDLKNTDYFQIEILFQIILTESKQWDKLNSK